MIKLRNTLALIALAALIHGCSSEHVGAEPAVEDVPITFGSDKTIATRANSDDFIDGAIFKTIPEDNEVGMYGYYQGTATWSDWTDSKTGEALIFNNKNMVSTGPIDGNPAKASLTYTNLRYWPNVPNAKCAFIAYYPYGSGTDVTVNGAGHFHVTTSDYSHEQTDFMVSEFRPNLTKPTLSNPTVNMVFNQMLAQVIINPTNSKYAHKTITKIAVTGVYKQGNLTVTYDGNTNYTWAVEGSKGAVYVTNFSGDNRILLLIPQAVSGAQISITYLDGGVEKTDPPYDIPAIEWEEGHIYIYNIGDGLSVHDIPILGTRIFDKASEGALKDQQKFSVSKLNPIKSQVVPGESVIAFYYSNPSSMSQWYFSLWLTAANNEIILKLHGGNAEPCSDGGRAQFSSEYEPRQAYYFRITPEMWALMNVDPTADYFAYVNPSSMQQIDVEAITIITDPAELALVNPYVHEE